MRILFTGASSFTGFWFVRELAMAGHAVVCALRSRPEVYAGIRRQRFGMLERLSGVEIVPGAGFGEPRFLETLRSSPWNLVCHHGAEVGNYKSAGFDVERAVAGNTLNLALVLEALKLVGNPAMVLTGTVFERGEGAGEEPLRAFSPYGESKTRTWEVFRSECAAAGARLGKFVISLPFGPWEEGRLTGYLMSCWRQGKAAEVRTPRYVRDLIPVDLLAMVYRRFAEDLARDSSSAARCNPAGYLGTIGEFAERMARETRRRTGWACELRFGEGNYDEPMSRVNMETAMGTVDAWEEERFWDGLVDWYSDQA